MRSWQSFALEISTGEKAVSYHDEDFTYEVGQRATAASWEDNWQIECGGGIHFYITREEAVAHL